MSFSRSRIGNECPHNAPALKFLWFCSYFSHICMTRFYVKSTHFLTIYPLRIWWRGSHENNWGMAVGPRFWVCRNHRIIFFVENDRNNHILKPGWRLNKSVLVDALLWHQSESFKWNNIMDYVVFHFKQWNVGHHWN